MFSKLPRQVGYFAVLAAVSISTVDAQSTNCMAMGPDMVQCYGTDGSSTNCMAMGPTMASCNTIGSANASANASSDGDPFDFIHALQARALRKKIGKMIAAGDCQGAARLAYEKGQIELGAAIPHICQPSGH